MNLPRQRRTQWPLVVAGLSVALAAILLWAGTPTSAWIQSSYRTFAGSMLSAAIDDPAEESTGGIAAPSRGRSKCRECGFVESTRLAASSGKRAVYEVTVRLADRTRHVLSVSDPSRWRPGERVILIGVGAQREQ